jgi:hypothetical protein
LGEAVNLLPRECMAGDVKSVGKIGARVGITINENRGSDPMVAMVKTSREGTHGRKR